MPITSPQNDKLKTLRKLRQRRRERDRLGQFVAEGEDLLAAADAAGWNPVERFAVSGSDLPGTEVDPVALQSVSELASGTRTLAIYSERWEAAPLGRLCVYLHGVSDPGNVGTVLRSAAAFGASCVAFGAGTADPFSPKAVRASMGAIFSVPVARATPAALPGTTIALDANADRTLADVASELSTDGEFSLLVGAERQGLPDDVIAAADHAARIPIVTESLNAAMAAAVALYELTRRISAA
ncbi:MAG TPA: RNA methyltransferase [Solirubrobacteraceae bacterium]|jgi:TrmH family RNA methyltransferase|nr:RNA methyltransferase [Solirubrobacteraceae bacterium]